MASVSESSVLCNLAELMQLESERVKAEQALAREALARAAREEHARARAEQERAERTRERTLAQEAQAREEHARRETEREAALLRTRLELEAKELLQRERTRLEHERALRQIERADRSWRGLRWLCAALALLSLTAAAAYTRVLAPALAAAHEAAANAQRDAAARSNEAAALRQRLLELQARDAKPPVARGDVVSGPPTAAKAETKHNAHPGPPKVTHKRDPQQQEPGLMPLGDLEGSDPDNDPLTGIWSAPGRRR